VEHGKDLQKNDTARTWEYPNILILGTLLTKAGGNLPTFADKLMPSQHGAGFDTHLFARGSKHHLGDLHFLLTGANALEQVGLLFETQKDNTLFFQELDRSLEPMEEIC
jgi:hypothetical protein